MNTVQDYIDNNPTKIMNVQRFGNALISKYDTLCAYLVQRGTEYTDAEDILQDFAVSGFERDWDKWNREQIKKALDVGKEPNTQYGFRDMKLTITSMLRDKYERGHAYTQEVAYSSNTNSEIEPDELSGELTFSEDEDEERLTKLVEEWQYSNEAPTEGVEFQSTEVYLDAVTERQAQAITLRRGRKNQMEIAEVMGIAQKNVALLLQRGYETLRDTFPELRRASRQWDSANLYVAPEGVATWNHNGFPHDTRELQYSIPRCYSEPAPEWGDAEVHRRRWVVRHDADRLRVDAKTIADNTLLGVDPAVFTSNRLRPWTRGVAPVASLDPISDTERYFASAHRLFNCLGLGKVMSPATEALIKLLMGKGTHHVDM